MNTKLITTLSALLIAGSIQAGVFVTGSTTSLSSANGSVNNDNLNPLQVNEDEIFGATDWTFAGKDESLSGAPGNLDELGSVDIGFQAGDGTLAGNWSFDANTWNDYDEVLIVLKGAANNSDPSNYIGYLLNDSNFSSGTYETPFSNPNNNNGKDISHISVYVRGGSPVPEPSTYAMFGAAFLMLGVAGYRSRNRKS